MNAIAQAEWLKPDGYYCPVSDHVVIDFVRRDGEAGHGPAGLWNSEQKHFSSWHHNGGNADIVSYRVADLISAEDQILSDHIASLAKAEG